jgi:hypothetical protein
MAMPQAPGNSTLRDLSPSEKAKVAQLMRKIVEQGQQLQTLQEQCSGKVSLQQLYFLLK